MKNKSNHKFIEVIKNRTIVFDGAMGTMIQKCNLHAHDFGGEALEGANDHLVITRPDVIEGIYKEYLEAGADVIETNSFGSNRLKLEQQKRLERWPICIQPPRAPVLCLVRWGRPECCPHRPTRLYLP
jgi:methionine synthase I (cobalamin-dependent)